MIAATVEFYDVVLFVHITSVVLAFGPTFAYSVFFAAAGKDGPGSLASVGRGVLAWSRGPGLIAMVLILASGVYLVADGPWDFSEFFVSWGFAAIIALFALSHGFFIPQTERFVEAIDAGRQEDAAGHTKRIQTVSPLASLLVLVTIYVMTATPFT
jgi:hypothetical protein